MRRVRFADRGGSVEQRVSALTDFARDLNRSLLLELTVVSGTIPAGASQSLVSHPLARAPLVAFLGSVSGTDVPTVRDNAATRAAGGDPTREVVVTLPSPASVPVFFSILLG